MRIKISSFVIGFTAVGATVFSILLSLVLIYPHGGAWSFFVLTALVPVALVLHSLIALRRETLDAIAVCRAGLRGKLSTRPVPLAETEFGQLGDALDRIIETLVRTNAQTQPVFDEAIRVCRAASAGHIGARLSGVDASTKAGEFARALNRLLDISETFLNDAVSNVTAAAEGRSYRHIPSAIYLGDHQSAADAVNGVLERIAERSRGDIDIAEALGRKVPVLTRQLADAAVALGIAAGRKLPDAEPFVPADAGPLDRTEPDPRAAVQRLDFLSDTADALLLRAQYIRDCKSDWGREVDRVVHSAERMQATTQLVAGTIHGFDALATAMSAIAERTAFAALDTAIAANRAGGSSPGLTRLLREIEDISGALARLSNEIFDQIGKADVELEAALKAFPAQPVPAQTPKEPALAKRIPTLSRAA
ncbi:MAG: hypothetical protein KDJ16_05800 [Hyphomicrobiales bacterium]|nr:hypothetical protein [Hyphomicrobiales bacterium]